MTTEKLEVPENDVKKVVTLEFLTNILIRSCAMFGFVIAKAVGGNSKMSITVEGGSLDLLVDI